MSLLGLLDYEDSSSSSSDSDENQEKDFSFNKLDNATDDMQETTEKVSLPSPNLDVNSSSSSSRTFQQSSVFYNPFKAREKEKLVVLEKHVQLSDIAPPETKTNKRICYKFQKGKCRYGDKCRFAHSTNPPKTGISSTKSDDSCEVEGLSHIKQHHTACEVVNEDDDTNVNKLKKRRVGVSDSLIPPKRAMKAFEKHKQNV